MNSKNLIFIIFLYGLLISYFMGYSLYNNNQLRNSLVFVNQEEGETEKEEKNNNPENEKKVKDNKQENKKKEKTEEKENNIPNEIIYPTFFLDNKKTMIGCQCLIEAAVLTVFLWYLFLRTNNAYSSYMKYNQDQNKEPNILEYIFLIFTGVDKPKYCLSLLFLWFLYFIVHAIVIFPLTLIFKWTSKNRYWSILKKYWKNHFNNLGCCFIFLLTLILWPCFAYSIDYWIKSKKK